MKIYNEIHNLGAYEYYGDTATRIVNELYENNLAETAFEQMEIELGGECTFDELCEWLETKGARLFDR